MRFQSVTTKPEVADFIRRCPFFVLPSLFVTFGVALIEGLAYGKTVLATDVGGPRQIVSHDEGKLVSPKDVDALVCSMDFMLDHYKELGQITS